MSSKLERLASQCLGKLQDTLQNAYVRLFKRDELLEQLGPIDETLPTKELRALIQQGLVRLLKTRLEADPSFNREFRRKTHWKWLNELLKTARAAELGTVRIVRRGTSFDVGEVKRSFHGKRLIKELPFSLEGRRQINAEELEQLKAAVAALGFELPEGVELTTTEKFFQEESD